MKKKTYLIFPFLIILLMLVHLFFFLFEIGCIEKFYLSICLDQEITIPLKECKLQLQSFAIHIKILMAYCVGLIASLIVALVAYRKKE